MSEHSSFQLLMEDLLQGREQAAQEIVEEYTAALVNVARRQISPKLARRIDPEDVVQSAYRSFFVRMGRGEFELGNGKALWKLLLTLTLNKVRKQGRFHRAQKRNVANDQSAASPSGFAPMADLAPADGPSPEDAAMLIDEVSNLLASLRDEDRPVIEMRLQGYNSVEIAQETGRSERTVRRVIERIERSLRKNAETEAGEES